MNMNLEDISRALEGISSSNAKCHTSGEIRELERTSLAAFRYNLCM
jgi:hypothetical protein